MTSIVWALICVSLVSVIIWMLLWALLMAIEIIRIVIAALWRWITRENK